MIFRTIFRHHTGYNVCIHIVGALCNFLYGHLATGWAKLYGSCAEIIRKLCDDGAFAVQSPQTQHGNHLALVQALCDDCARAIRSPYNFLGPNDLKSWDFHKISMQLLHNAPMNVCGLQAYNFFKFVLSPH